VLVLTRLQPTATHFCFPNHELISCKSQAAIKAALNAGHLIPGAQLISRHSWRIH
jgi:hypothetical protein